jgi:excisionase family DNA binding protein
MNKRATRANVTGISNDEPYIDIPEAAALLRRSQVSIRRFLTEGKLRRFKCGGRTLLRRDDVLGLVREM